MKNINYLFDNQVTPEEFAKITDELIKMWEGSIYKNLRTRVEDVLSKMLVCDLKDDSEISIDFHYQITKTAIDSMLGNIRKGKGKKK
jgi:hypothetical protein